MKKVFTILLFLVCVLAYTQEKKTNWSFEFENINFETALLEIENKTNYKFYFLKDWLDQKQITASFKDENLETILDEIFKETTINYFIRDQRIILTQNSVIYNKLPESFYRNQSISSETNTQEASAPIFTDDQSKSASNSITTVKIGKANKNSNKTTYSVSGVVKNKTTGEPIPNLGVLVKEKNLSAITDDNGFYEIKLPAGIFLIETSALGVQSIKTRVVVYNDGELNLQLQEDHQLLDEVVVNAEADKNVEKVITGVTKIEIEGIKNIPLVLGERDILKVATTMPGITKTGEGSSGYNVRGGKEDQNLILLDNAVIYNPVHFFGIFSALNPFTSGEANIYKGSIPSQFGGRLSSVFDIKTRDANTNKVSGEASLGPVTGNLMIETPIVKEKSALMVGARASYSDWILKKLEEENLKNSEATFYDVITKYNHRFSEKDNIKATAYFSKDRFSITSDSLYSYNNLLFSAEWNHNYNDKTEGSLYVSQSNYEFNIEYNENENRDFELGYDISETDLKYLMNHNLNSKHDLQYGLSGKLYSVLPGNQKPLGDDSIVERFSVPREKGIETALFLSDNFEINDKFSLEAGLRYSWYAFLGETQQRTYENGKPKNEETVVDTLNYGNNEIAKNYGGPEFRVSSRYFLKPDLSVKASFNSTYQYIHMLSNNTTVSPIDTWKLSDLNIKPQKAWMASLGVYKNFDENTYELSIEGYYKKSKDILDFKVGAELFLNEHVETEVLQGLGKAYGVEFLLKKDEGRLNGWVGYSYSRSFFKLDSQHAEERVNNGAYFPSNYDKPHNFNLVSNYRLTKRYSFSANFVYQTGRPVTFPVGEYEYQDAKYVYYSNRNQYRIPDYFRLDLGLNIEGNHKIKKLAHSFWNISVYNVLGRNNPYSVFFVTDSGEIKAYKSSIFAIPVPTITYNLKF
ncbi:TonB-dependent receptor domain-containing protein [Zhouia amylolytica]|uniref:Putative TonB-dependent outer membrane receptor protein n=1 Tax=Zhouia amylolytica AD3 TaxID=1286632 RepID=W2UP26_9FLAO|nr:TonB-dependent receptor [Zhouia amylolytica]ETN95699.1 putative TonB-dependent outer membrane receptor protein [Zhouia amylolytica AD3]